MDRVTRCVLSLVVAVMATVTRPVEAEFAPFTDPNTKNSPNIAVPTSVQVDGRMGTASYTYAFSAPPGNGGLTPTVALEYNSLIKNTEYGYGWTIRFFSRIERSTRQGVPCYGDANCKNPNYQSGDEFEIDGELLVPDPVVAGRYHKKRVDFSRIEFSGNTWTVKRPDGTKLTYGLSSSSRLSDPSDTTKTFRWALERIEDPRGNQIRIKYTTFGENSNLYPLNIRYSFHKTSALSKPRRLVQFAWERRGATEALEDRPTSYRAGFKVQAAWRLKYVATGIVPNETSLLIQANGAVQSGASLASKHELIYAGKPGSGVTPEHPDPFSKLIAIQRYGNTDAAFPSRTDFSYSDPASAFDETPILIDHGLGTASLNYEGIMSAWENPWAQYGDVWVNVTETSSGQLVDMNGDSIADRVVLVAQANAPPFWQVALGRVDSGGMPSFDPPVEWSWTAPAEDGYVGDTLPPEDHSYYGQSFSHSYYGNNPLEGGYLRISESYSYFVEIPRNDSRADPFRGLVTVADLVDMDGDGLPDRVISRSNDDWTVYFNTGSGFDGPHVWSAPQVFPYNTVSEKRFLGFFEGSASKLQAISNLIDINGDGRPDHLVRTDATTAKVSFNNGVDGFDAPIDLPLTDYGVTGQANHEIFSTLKNFMDINGDGLPDRVFGAGKNMPVSANQLLTILNTGSGMTTAESVTYGGPAALNKGVQESVATADPLLTHKFGPMPYSCSQQPAACYGDLDTRAITASYVDIDGDGMLDHIKTDTSGQYQVYYGLGDGHFLGLAREWETHGARIVRNGLSEDVIYSPDILNNNLVMSWVMPILSDINPSIVASSVISPLLSAGYNTDPKGNTVSALIDINGDGLLDRVMANDPKGIVGNLNSPNYANLDRRWKAYLHPGPSGLLTEVTNEIGGRTFIEYKPSTHFTNEEARDFDGTNRDVAVANSVKSMGRPVFVVTQITTEDGRASTDDSQVRYGYATPRYDVEDRELLGMKMSAVTRVDETEAEVSQTRIFYRQQSDIPALVEFSQNAIRAGANWDKKQESHTVYTLSHPLAVPSDANSGISESHFVSQTTSTTQSFEPGGAQRAQKSSMRSASYGTPLFEVEGGLDGNLSTQSDNITTVMSYDDVDEAAWLISYPSTKKVFSHATSRYVQWEAFEYEDGLVTRYANVNPQNPSEETVIVQEYDDYGNVTKFFDAMASVTPTKTITYDDMYKTFVSSSANELGHTTHYEFDARTGQIERFLDQDTHLTCSLFDEFGRVTEIREPSSQSAQSLTDTCNQLLVKHDYFGIGDVESQYNQSTTYDMPGHIASVSRSYFDGLGRTYKSTQSQRASSMGEHIVTLQSWDSLGKLACQSIPFRASPDAPRDCFVDAPQYSRHMYDDAGRKMQTIHSELGLMSSFAYGMGGDNVATVTQTTYGTPNRVKIAHRDNRGQVVTVQEQAGTTTIERDALGRIVRVDGPDVAIGGQPSHPNVMLLEYDYLGQRKALRKPRDLSDITSGRNWRYDYDDNGNLTYVYSPRTVAGACPSNALDCHDIKYHYDTLGRLERKDVAPLDIDNGEDQVYAYDDCEFGLGRVCREGNAEVALDLHYDVRGRIASRDVIYHGQIIHNQAISTDSLAYSFSFGYDLTNRLTSKSYPDGDVILFNHDGDVLESVRSDRYGTYLNQLDYDELGRLTTVHYAQGNYTSTFDYDPDDQRLKGIGTSAGSGTILQDLNYAYDAAGNPQTITDGLGLLTQSYTYDGRHRLKTATGTGAHAYAPQVYGPDAAGNLYRGSSSYGATPQAGAHGLLDTFYAPTSGSLVGLQYDYDLDGNVISRTASGATQSLEWDPHNRLAHIELPDGDRLSFSYDNDGKRMRKVRCESEFGCGSHPSSTATVDRLYVDDDFEVDLVGGDVYKHIWVGGKRLITTQQAGDGAPQPYQALAPAGPVDSTDDWNAAHGLDGWTAAQATPAMFVMLVMVLAFLGLTWFGANSLELQPLAVLALLALVCPLSMGIGNCPGPVPEGPTLKGIFNQHYDHLGSLTLITSGKQAGQVLQRTFYDPYGALHHQDTAANPQGQALIPGGFPGYGFTSQERDPESGLIYFGARYYDPLSGRFLSPDPALNDGGESFGRIRGEPQALNAYAYADNRPTVMVDPDGEYPVWFEVLASDNNPLPATTAVRTSLMATEATRRGLNTTLHVAEHWADTTRNPATANRINRIIDRTLDPAYFRAQEAEATAQRLVGYRLTTRYVNYNLGRGVSLARTLGATVGRLTGAAVVLDGVYQVSKYAHDNLDEYVASERGRENYLKFVNDEGTFATRTWDVAFGTDFVGYHRSLSEANWAQSVSFYQTYFSPSVTGSAGSGQGLGGALSGGSIGGSFSSGGGGGASFGYSFSW